MENGQFQKDSTSEISEQEFLKDGGKKIVVEKLEWNEDDGTVRTQLKLTPEQANVFIQAGISYFLQLGLVEFERRARKQISEIEYLNSTNIDDLPRA